jgi:hypothetical protein
LGLKQENEKSGEKKEDDEEEENENEDELGEIKLSAEETKKYEDPFS